MLDISLCSCMLVVIQSCPVLSFDAISKGGGWIFGLCTRSLAMNYEVIKYTTDALDKTSLDREYDIYIEAISLVMDRAACTIVKNS